MMQPFAWLKWRKKHEWPQFEWLEGLQFEWCEMLQFESGARGISPRALRSCGYSGSSGCSLSAARCCSSRVVKSCGARGSSVSRVLWGCILSGSRMLFTWSELRGRLLDIGAVVDWDAVLLLLLLQWEGCPVVAIGLMARLHSRLPCQRRGYCGAFEA